LRLFAAVLSLGFAVVCHAQTAPLPDAPQPVSDSPASSGAASTISGYSSSEEVAELSGGLMFQSGVQAVPSGQNASSRPSQHKSTPDVSVDENGNPIPLERQQPQRLLGFMPNFRSVSGGAKPHPPGWKYNFVIATRQATDYSSFIFLGLTSLTAEAENEHPVLGKGVGGFYSYTWHGFLDKTDGTYLSAWLLPNLLREDTRFYAMGSGHPIFIRSLYVISREGVAVTYSGHQTPNIAGLGGKVLTQVISRYYYPTGATSFSVLATKFGYSVMRDVAFQSIREFYPDIAAHYIRKHRAKMARIAQRDATIQ
jgi:hypothetical protein